MTADGRFLASLFVGTERQPILDLAHQFLMIHGALYSILALLFVFRYTLQGLGNAVIPTVAGLMELAMRALAAFIWFRSLNLWAPALKRLYPSWER